MNATKSLFVGGLAMGWTLVREQATDPSLILAGE